MQHNIYILILLFSVTFYFKANSQISVNNGNLEIIDYTSPVEYEIGGITISGIRYLDQNVLIGLSGLTVGDKIEVPGKEITKAVEKLWKQGLFSDIKIKATKIIGSKIFLDIFLQERPRLSKFSFSGIKKSDADEIREKIKLVKGSQVTDNVISNTRNIIKDYYLDKGFYNADITITQSDDSLLINNVILNIDIKKKKRVKINEISFEGNNVMKAGKLRRAMKETKQKRWYNIFKASKMMDNLYKEDKNKIIAKYNSKGYRDAVIVTDTVYKFSEKTLNVHIKVNEGKKYYIRNITWVGNTIYSSERLGNTLGVKKGDIFDQSVLDNKISIAENSVSSLYLDEGYLFFQANPTEVGVVNDSIDLEIRIYEGKQATINHVTITGNTTTNEHVIRREIRTKPGELFSRSDIIRTQRELAQLGFFDPEKLNVNPVPNPAEGTVDLEYIVEEKPSSQIELSGGYGANMIVGTLGLVFNNFSLRNILHASAWRPLPSGDGQRLSLRAQTNGKYYQSYNLSFVEPWFGGKKPNSFSVSGYHSIQTNGEPKPDQKSIRITGVATGVGRRLKWPDDYFTLYNELSYQYYDLSTWSGFLYSTGTSNNVSLLTSFGRNSIDAPIYPRKGSSFTLSLQITPPYSVFREDDYSTMDAKDKYKWIEYHKWTFSSTWFTTLAKDLVLCTRTNFGFLGLYNKELGPSPFEGYEVGGDGLSGYRLYGKETVALRGYENNSITPDKGANMYDKFTLELRYPISLNPSATLYALAFTEAGNAWYEFKEFNPFSIKRSAGVGVRIFLPMMGMLGVDWGYGFDDIPGRPSANKSQFHFVIGQQF